MSDREIGNSGDEWRDKPHAMLLGLQADDLGARSLRGGQLISWRVGSFIYLQQL